MVSGYLLASVREFHEQRGNDDLGRLGRFGFLAHLRVLEQDVLVELDAPLQDLQEDVQRVVAQRRFHHVQQRFVLDEPLLDVVLFEREEPLVRGGHRRRPVGHGASHQLLLLLRQVQFLQFGQGDLVRVDHAVEFHLQGLVQVHQVLVGRAHQSVIACSTQCCINSFFFFFFFFFFLSFLLIWIW